MIIAERGARQTGAIYVEAAIIMPVLLLVVFASIFFFLLAARHFSLQMLANDIAKDISLSLDPRTGVSTGAQGGCFQRACAYTTPLTDYKLDLDTLLANRYTASNGCWKVCAQQQYLLATQNALQVTLTAHPTIQWFDTVNTAATTTQVAVGDYIEVELRYPARAVLGGGIAMFGATPDVEIVGTAISVLERPSSEVVED